MKQLRHRGRYHVALSGYEYVVMNTANPSLYGYVLFAPQDTAYPHAPNLIVNNKGDIYSNEGKLAITSDDLNFSGRYHDFTTGKAEDSKAVTAREFASTS